MNRDLLLVHGSFHNGTCWNEIVPDLREAGWNPAAISLPGHERDARSRWRVTWANYLDAVVAAAKAMPSGCPVVLGHSMGGHVVSGAVERDPTAFSGVTFISAAIASPDGSELRDMTISDAMRRAIRPAVLRGAVTIKPDRAAEIFYNTCDAEVAASAVARLVPQPIRPPTRSRVVATSTGLGSLPLTYIECTRDNALPLAVQRQIQASVAINDVVTIDSDHSPFLSARGEVVAALARFYGD